LSTYLYPSAYLNPIGREFLGCMSGSLTGAPDIWVLLQFTGATWK